MTSTIKDVAKRAKVSVSTVSNVINNKESVTKGLKKRVLEAVEELKYRPNRFAQGLPRKRTFKSNFVRIIGLSMPHYYSHGLKLMAAAVKYRAAEVEAQIIEYLSENDYEKQRKQISEKIRRQVDAIICFPTNCREIEKSVQECNVADIPFISLNRFTCGDVYAIVKSDDYKAGNDLGLCLVLGLKGRKGRILEIEGEITDFNSIQRSTGFDDVVTKWPGLQVVRKYRCDWNAEKAKSCIIRGLRDYPDINVIFSHNDEMAIGALNALKELGRDYPVDHPDHIILLGVDGNRFVLNSIRNQFFDATAEQLLWEQGTKAVDLAMDAINGKVRYHPITLIPTTLITRENVDYVNNHWADYDLSLTGPFPVVKRGLRRSRLSTSK